MPHAHHDIVCEMPEDSIWCFDIEAVLAHLRSTHNADYAFVRERIERFVPLSEEIERQLIEDVRAGKQEMYGPTSAFG